MMYFDKFPMVYYTFDKDLQEFYTLKNIFTRIDVLSSVLTNSLVFYKYAVQDSDTPETIAFKYYGDAQRHWIVLLANVMIDPYFDWPLKTEDFNANIIANYGSLANAQSQLDHIDQVETVTTIFQGTSNTITYNSTLTDTPYTYNFLTNSLQNMTLPTINNPIITLSSVTVVTPDGATVTTTTTLNAVSCYDNEVAINEAKREITLIDPSYVGQLEAQFQSLLNT